MFFIYYWQQFNNNGGCKYVVNVFHTSGILLVNVVMMPHQPQD